MGGDPYNEELDYVSDDRPGQVRIIMFTTELFQIKLILKRLGM